MQAFSYQFSADNYGNSTSLAKYRVRRMYSHNINSTSPANTQRVTHKFSAVQQDCLTLKMQATRPFETSRLSDIGA